MAVDSAVLGCGRSIDDVWENISRAPMNHERQCEQCQSARESLLGVQQLTRRYRGAEERAQHHPEPEERPSPGVRSRLLAVARAEVRRGRLIPVAATARGPILISEQTLLVLVRTAVDTIPGVRARRIETSGLVRARDAQGDGTVPDVRITCRVAVAPGVVIPRVAEEAREAITTAVGQHLQLQSDAVDIIVEDLYAQ